MITFGVLGGGGNELKLSVESPVLSPSPGDHRHKEIAVAGPPVEVPEDLEGSLRIIRFDFRERKPAAIEANQGTLLVQGIPTHHVLPPVARRRVFPGRGDFHVHVWEEIKFPSRLREERAQAIYILDRQMFPRLERGRNFTILLKPVTHGFIAAISISES